MQRQRLFVSTRLKTLLPLGAVLAVLLLAACDAVGNTVVTGNGDVEERTIDVGGFDAVELRGVGTVNISTGDETTVSLRAESNIADVLTQRVSGGTLILSVERNTSVTPTEGIIYTVTLPELTRIELEGAGSFNVGPVTGDSLSIQTDGAGGVTVERVDLERLTVTLGGVGSITIRGGTVEEQTVRLDGVGSYNARNVTSTNADVEVDGAGSVTVNVIGELTGGVDGVGSLRYAGDPETVEVTVDGLGSLGPLGE